MKSKAAPSAPRAWKNTYFTIAVILLVVGLIGLVRGEDLIRDPGQRPESHLAFWYIAAAVVMFVNGWLSHRSSIRDFNEGIEE